MTDARLPASRVLVLGGLSSFRSSCSPPLASLGGVTPVVMARSILATATVAALPWFTARTRASADAAGG